MPIIHVGRKVPKGYEELPGAMHLGKGIWIFKMKPIKKPATLNDKGKLPLTSPASQRQDARKTVGVRNAIAYLKRVGLTATTIASLTCT